MKLPQSAMLAGRGVVVMVMGTLQGLLLLQDLEGFLGGELAEGLLRLLGDWVQMVDRLVWGRLRRTMDHWMWQIFKSLSVGD